MAINALIPAARMLATKVATNPAVREFGKEVLTNVAGTALDAASKSVSRRIDNAFAPPENLARRTASREDGPPRPQGDAGQARRAGATQALAMLKARDKAAGIE